MLDGEPEYSAGLGIGTAVAGSGDDKARAMDERKAIKQTVAGSVLALVAVGWLLGTPYLVFARSSRARHSSVRRRHPRRCNRRTCY